MSLSRLALLAAIIAQATLGEPNIHKGPDPKASPAPLARLLDEASDRCPRWTAEKDAAPPCPKTGNTVLPDTYPALAHIVSDDFNPSYGNWEPYQKLEYWKAIKRKLAVQFTLHALAASEPKTPMMVLPVHEETLKAVKDAIHKATEGDEKRRKRWLASLLFVPDGVYKWQRDPSVPVMGKESRSVEMRPVEGYREEKGESRKATDKVIEAIAAACPLVKRGAPLKLPKGEKLGDGHAGGNVVGLPGGLVARGKNQSEDYAKQYSGKAENQVALDTDWLFVGHTDEILGVLPHPKQEAPCNFAIAIPSPAKALELMESDAHKDKRVIDIPLPATGVISAEEETKHRTEFILWYLCNAKNSSLDREREEKKRKPMSSEEKDKLLKACTGMRMGEAAKFIKEFPEWGVTHALIQKKIDGTKEILRKRLKERLPECADKVRFVDVPVLYQPMYPPVAVKGAKPDAPVEQRFTLRKEAARAWLPNMVNSAVASGTVVSPHPHNDVFADYMKKIHEELGGKVDFVDDYYYATSGSGDIHCATQTLRFCL